MECSKIERANVLYTLTSLSLLFVGLNKAKTLFNELLDQFTKLFKLYFVLNIQEILNLPVCRCINFSE